MIFEVEIFFEKEELTEKEGTEFEMGVFTVVLEFENKIMYRLCLLLSLPLLIWCQKKN